MCSSFLSQISCCWRDVCWHDTNGAEDRLRQITRAVGDDEEIALHAYSNISMCLVDLCIRKHSHSFEWYLKMSAFCLFNLIIMLMHSFQGSISEAGLGPLAWWNNTWAHNYWNVDNSSGSWGTILLVSQRQQLLARGEIQSATKQRQR